MLNAIFSLFSLFIFLSCAMFFGANGQMIIAFIALTLALVSFGTMWLAIWKAE